MAFKEIMNNSKKETNLWSAKPHEIRFLWLSIPRALFWMFLVFLFFPWVPIDAVFYVIIGLILAVCAVIYSYFLWKTMKYFVTEDGIYLDWGILRKIKKFVPFYKITNYSETQGIIQQGLEIGTLNIQTAGTGQTNIPELMISDVSRTKIEALIEIINKQIKKNK